MRAVEEAPSRLPMSDVDLTIWEVELSRNIVIPSSSVQVHWSSVKAFIDRIRTTEEDRDQARRARCEAQHDTEQIGYDERGTHWSHGPRTALEIAAEEYGQAEASRLFPPEVPT